MNRGKNKKTIIRESSTLMKPEEVYKLVEDIRKELKADMTKIEDTADRIFVKVEAFDPVRKIVYGLVGIILTAVILAVAGLVIQK
jgi:hypothetical protein